MRRRGSRLKPVAHQELPPYELFFAELEVVLSPAELEMVQCAYIFSKYGHYKQKRDDGTRYFDHPKAAAWIYVTELGGRDPRMITLLLLHDLSEDAYLLSPYRVSLNFGKEIALDVRAVTKLPKGKETTAQYIARVARRGPEAMTAKLCDRLHNLRTLRGCSPEKRLRILEETHEYYLETIIPALMNCGDPWRAFAHALSRKINEAVTEREAELAPLLRKRAKRFRKA